MAKALILWTLSAALILSGIYYGIYGWFVHGSGSIEINSQMSWMSFIFEMLSQGNWQLMLTGLACGLLMSLAALIYYSGSLDLHISKLNGFKSEQREKIDAVLIQYMNMEKPPSAQELGEEIQGALQPVINAIRAEAEVVDVDNPKNVSEKLNSIKSHLDRAGHFVESLVGAKTPGEGSRCFPEPILAELVKDWESEVNTKGVQVTNQISDAGEVGIPGQDIKLIFQSILKFQSSRILPDSGKIKVAVRLVKSGHGFHFEIEDNLPIDGQIDELREEPDLAFAAKLLGGYYSGLEIEPSSEGIRLSFDILTQGDQVLDALTAISIDLSKD